MTYELEQGLVAIMMGIFSRFSTAVAGTVLAIGAMLLTGMAGY